jgi:HEPN domain-containing protein
MRFFRGYFGRKTSTPVQDSMNAHFFVRSGYEYYANARFAMEAQNSYVCGNLFHHAVEMLLKADLAKNGKSLDELASMRHNLKRLWRAYKRNHPAAALSRHDRTINRLDKHEDIRYPDPSLGSIGVSIEWSGEPGSVKVFGRGMRSPKQYAVVVSDIDDLVGDIIRASSWNPGAFVGTSPAALEAIRRHNIHADFLTHGKIP